MAQTLKVGDNVGGKTNKDEFEYTVVSIVGDSVRLRITDHYHAGESVYHDLGKQVDVPLGKIKSRLFGGWWLKS